MTYSNKTLKPPVSDKPHIGFRAGWWRVSPQKRPYHKTALDWGKAHAFANRLNEAKGEELRRECRRIERILKGK